MINFPTLKKVLFVVMFLPVFSGCISGVPPTDSYTDHSGKTTVFQTDAELCVQSCNDDYDRCMDSEDVEKSGVNGPAGMFGASANCHNTLRSCLSTCRGR